MILVTTRARNRELGAMAPTWKNSSRACLRKSRVLDDLGTIVISWRNGRGNYSKRGTPVSNGRLLPYNAASMRRAVTLATILMVLLPRLSWGAQGVPREMEDRFAAILALEDRRSAGEGELAGYLSAREPLEVRERAVLAAGRIGSPVVSPYLLLDVLSDKAARLRRMAAFALGEMDDVTAAPLLAVLLGDPDAGVRAMAAEALGKLKDPDSVPRLMAALDDRDAEVAGMTLLALWKIEMGTRREPIVRKAE